PVFHSKYEIEWSLERPTADRITATSSTMDPTCGNSSETSIPDAPYFLNLYGLRMIGPGNPCWTWTSPSTGSGCPWYLSSAGLGSNVSRWLTPPHMKSEMTFFTRGLKCGVLGENGEATPVFSQ